MAKSATPPGDATVTRLEFDAMIARGRAEPGETRTLQCRTVATGRLQQMNYIRDLPAQAVMEDERQDLSSESFAPNASEALLAALGSCLAVGIHANALAQGIPISTLELSLSANINTTAIWGAGNSTPKIIGFDEISVSVKLIADAPRKALEALVRHATLWSPVANTIHNPVHLDVTLQADPVPA
jgi:uncharacterized OsmC-like protein